MDQDNSNQNQNQNLNPNPNQNPSSITGDEADSNLAAQLSTYINAPSNYLNQPTYQPQPRPSDPPGSAFGFQTQNHNQNQNQNQPQDQNIEYGQYSTQLYNQQQPNQIPTPNRPASQLPDPNIHTGDTSTGASRPEYRQRDVGGARRNRRAQRRAEGYPAQAESGNVGGMGIPSRTGSTRGNVLSQPGNSPTGVGVPSSEYRLGGGSPSEYRLGGGSPSEYRLGGGSPSEYRLGGGSPSEYRLGGSTPSGQRRGGGTPSGQRPTVSTLSGYRIGSGPLSEYRLGDGTSSEDRLGGGTPSGQRPTVSTPSGYRIGSGPLSEYRLGDGTSSEYRLGGTGMGTRTGMNRPSGIRMGTGSQQPRNPPTGAVGSSSSGIGESSRPGPYAVPGLDIDLPENQAAFQEALFQSIQAQEAAQRDSSPQASATEDEPYGPPQEDILGNPIFPGEWRDFFIAHGIGRAARYNRQLETDVVYSLTPIQWIRQFCRNMARASEDERRAEWARLFGDVLSPAWLNFFTRELSMITPVEWIAILIAIDNGEGPERAIQWHHGYRDEYARLRQAAAQARGEAQGAAQGAAQGQAREQGGTQPPAADDPNDPDARHDSVDPDDPEGLYNASPPGRSRGTGEPFLPRPGGQGPGRDPLAAFQFHNPATNTTMRLQASRKKPSGAGGVADAPEYWGKYDDDGPPRLGEDANRFKERIHRARYNMQIRRRPAPPFNFSQNANAAQRYKENEEQRKVSRLAEQDHQERLTSDLQYAQDWAAQQKARRDQNSARRKAAFEHKKRTLAALNLRVPNQQPAEPNDSDHEDLYDRPPPALVPAGDDPPANNDNDELSEDDEDRDYEAFQCQPCIAARKGCSNKERRYPCDRCITIKRQNECVRRFDRTAEQEAAQVRRQRPAAARQYGPYIPSFYTVLSDSGQIPPDLAGGIAAPSPAGGSRRVGHTTATTRAIAAGEAPPVRPRRTSPEMKRKRDNMDDDGEDDDTGSPPASRKRHASSKKKADRPACDQCTKHSRICDREQPCSQCETRKIPCNATFQDRPFHNLDPSGNSHLVATHAAEQGNLTGVEGDLPMDVDLVDQNPEPPAPPKPPAPPVIPPIDPNLQPSAEIFGPAQDPPQPPIPANQALIPDDRPTDAQARAIHQHLSEQVDPDLPQTRTAQELEAEQRRSHLQHYPAGMADEDEASARANWGSNSYPPPADPNRHDQNTRAGVQRAVDEDIEMEDAAGDPDPDPLSCGGSFPSEAMAAVPAANWRLPDVPLGQEPVDMTMDPGKTCRELAGFLWWNDRPDLPGATSRADERRRLRELCGTRNMSHPTQRINWRLIPRDPAKDCDHLLDDDICSCMACRIDQIGRMKHFHREDELVNNTKKWFCVACKARLDTMRQQPGGVQNLMIGQCSCIGQLRSTWLCNVHRFRTKQIIETRLRARLGQMFNYPPGWHRCPTGWCANDAGYDHHGEDDSGAWQCRNCCSVVSIP